MAHEDKVFSPGEVIAGRYEIVEELGRGAYGVVFRAIQLGIGRHVALKTLLPQMAVNSEEHQRFEREALLISRLSHPNIITLFDYGEYQGVYFMVMEYVEGRSLGELIEEEAPLAPELARALTMQMLDALQYAHDQGVVHRDLKPENIRLLSQVSVDGQAEETLKILDFGIAKFVQGEVEGSALDTLTQTGIALGTPQYMSPENITGDPVSHHADLYAVGLVLYEMLTGEPAFTGANPHIVMVSHIKDDPPRLEGELASAGFSRALAWSLQKQPDERVPSARAMRELLEEDNPAKAKDAGSAVVLKAPSRALVAIALAATIVVILLAMVVLLGQSDDEENPAALVGAESLLVGAETFEEAAGEEMVFEPEQAFAEGVEEASVEEAGVEEAGVEEVNEDEEEEEWAEEITAEASPPEPSVAQRPDPEPEPEPELSEVEIRFISHPENARITLEGAPIGVAPMSRQLPRGEDSVEIGFSLIGYRDKVVNLVPNKDQAIEVRLERGRLNLVP